MKFKNLLIEDTHSPATDEDIKVLEYELDCTIPNDYLAFLKACNGGYLEYEILVEFENKTNEYLSFCCLYRAGSQDEWECNPFELLQEKKGEGFPQRGVLPIARDGGSSVLYLDLRDGYKVVAYIQGLPGWTGAREKSTVIELAGSFEEYLHKLTLSEETIENHIENFNVDATTVNATIEWLDSVGVEWREVYKD